MRIITFSKISLFLSAVIFLGSCCTMNSPFSKPKYLDGQQLSRSKVKSIKHEGVVVAPIEKAERTTTLQINEEEKTLLIADAGSEVITVAEKTAEVPAINFHKTVKENASLSNGENSERPTLKQRVASRVIKKAIERSSRRPGDEAETVILVILCFLLPPLAVYIKTDDIGLDFWISVLLTIFFWVPGIIWALYVCFFR